MFKAERHKENGEEALIPFTMSCLFVGCVIPASCSQNDLLKSKDHVSLKGILDPVLSIMQINKINVPVL